MAEHDLFLGGQRTDIPEYHMFPQKEYHPDQESAPTSHKDTVRYSLTRDLDFKFDDCCFATGEARGSQGLATYLDYYGPIVAGDVLNVSLLPRYTSLVKIWWLLKEPVEGLTVDIQVRGNANSLGGTLEAPVPVVLATDVDLGVAAPEDNECLLPSGLIGVPLDASNMPDCQGLYFDQNDMLHLVIKTLPEEADLRCLRFCLSPVIDDYCEGSY